MKPLFGDPRIAEENRVGHELQYHHELTITIYCSGKSCQENIVEADVDSEDYEQGLDNLQIALARQGWWKICQLPYDQWGLFCQNCAPNITHIFGYRIPDPRNSLI